MHAAFCASIAHHNQDIIFGCKSKISPDVIIRPMSNSIVDFIITTNPNLLTIITNIETHTDISDRLLVTYDICMKTKYQTKPPRKKFHLQKADTNNLRPKVHNFTQEFLN